MSFKNHYIELKKAMAIDQIEIQVLEFVGSHPLSSSTEIVYGTGMASLATVKRTLQKLMAIGHVLAEGKGRATRYILSPSYELTRPVDIDAYFSKEVDERSIRPGFPHDLISRLLPAVDIFTKSELARLDELQSVFAARISKLSPLVLKKERERLAIDLSWKSSQIEGNIYTLLETERLIKEHETASGKSKDDATMLLNHKEAIDFIIENTGFSEPLRVSAIEDIHGMLMKGLGVERNIRKHQVGITGTNYKPLDNQYQIREALEEMCTLVNNKMNVFEKSILALALLSYIQPFEDGNKRTARIMSNAILLDHGYCPMSFRTVDSIRYKMAMLVFYEQNNIQPVKEIFMSQFEFAVNTYF